MFGGPSFQKRSPWVRTPLDFLLQAVNLDLTQTGSGRRRG